MGITNNINILFTHSYPLYNYTLVTLYAITIIYVLMQSVVLSTLFTYLLEGLAVDLLSLILVREDLCNALVHSLFGISCCCFLVLL